MFAPKTIAEMRPAEYGLKAGGEDWRGLLSRPGLFEAACKADLEGISPNAGPLRPPELRSGQHIPVARFPLSKRNPAMREALFGMLVCVLVTEHALAQSAPSTARFVETVALSDMLEIQSSQLIAPNADEHTKSFAKRMITDHTNTSNELKLIVQQSNSKADVPSILDAEHQAKLDGLSKLSGSELNHAYDRMQVEAHQEAVELFTRYSRNGDNPELKEWAAKTLPKLQEHLRMARELN
ncbi:MAG: DUF4142 domain-containing protein [Acetobacteraceae bacterium]|nr:DUF4142 domain-containing protein [Acetobacteraceae bacterium]